MGKRQLARTTTKSAQKTATVQKQSTKHASASVPQQITSTKQSLELIQTTVHASISTLLFLKNLFMDSCFEMQKEIPGEAHVSYKDYAAGKSSKPTSSTNEPRGNSMVIMRRGRSSRLDQLLDWLEHGVFDALVKGRLRRLQISLSELDEGPTNILELYNFDFRSSNTNAINVQISNQQGHIGESPGSKITVQGVRAKIHSFAKSIITLNGGLPRLPNSVSLKLYMYLTRDTPEGYIPEGFELKPADDIFVMFPGGELGVDEYQIPSIDAGYHKVKLSSVFRATNSTNDGSQTPFPNMFMYGVQHSLLDGIDDEDKRVSTDSTPGVLERTPTADIPAQEPEPNQSSNMPVRLSGERARQAVENSTPSGTVQQSGGAIGTPIEPTDLNFRDRLRLMQPLSQIHDYVNDTQIQSSSPVTATLPQGMLFSQRTLQKLDQGRPSRSHTQSDGRSPDQIRCTCGDQNFEETQMVLCDYCGYWHHACCYGYSNHDDPRLSGSILHHACYECLLHDEEETLEKLQELAMYRRIIYAIDAQGCGSATGVMNAMHYKRNEVNKTIVTKVLRKLKHEGVLTQQSRSKKQGDKGWQIIKSTSLLEKYFDPFSEIAHLVKCSHHSRTSTY
ncbi:HORMA domain-containing protein [Dendryphion nanum]|uniref:HORMA domain-containing protein n=1 Tax=Dendryphion nanum TaxID=256645 RepID=A0A9P9EE64_9PLEO|nr:HORMA domain-containing protein [Dendryphion nanum]